MASYPGTLREFVTHVNTTEVIDSSHMNEVQGEIVAVQKILAVNPHISTAGAGSSLGAWSGSSRTYASLSDRLANIEAGIVGDTHSQYAKASGDATFTGTKIFSGPDTFFGTSTASSSANLYASTGTTGGTAALVFREGAAGRWQVYRTQGASTLLIRDLVNARDHVVLTPGASNTAAVTTLASSLQVQGNLTVTGTLTTSSITKTVRVSHGFALPGEIIAGTVLPGFFAAAPAGQTTKLVGMRHRITSGTSATVSVRVEGTAATGFSGINVTPTSTTTDPADVSLADGAYVDLLISAVSGAVQAISVTLYYEYTV